MKKSFKITLWFFVWVLIINLCIIKIVNFVIKTQIKKVLAGSEVRFKNNGLFPLGEFQLRNFLVNSKDGVYFKVEQISIYYDFKILSRVINCLSIKDLEFDYIKHDKSLDNISTFLTEVSAKKKKAFLIKTFDINDIKFNIELNDLQCKGQLSADLSLSPLIVNDFLLKLKDFKFQDLSFEELNFILSNQAEVGQFEVTNIHYQDKLKIKSLQALPLLKSDRLNLENIQANFFDNIIAGSLEINWSNDLNYRLSLAVQSFNISALVEIFEMKNRFDLTGYFTGQTVLEGSITNIQDLKFVDGYFLSQEPGGNLVIRDQKFLENLAVSSKQPLELIKSSFENYQYNNSLLKVFTKDKDLFFNISFDGKQGKRNLEVVLHDF